LAKDIPGIRAGRLIVNGGMPYAADLPFGGYKASGLGRQNGTAGLAAGRTAPPVGTERGPRSIRRMEESKSMYVHTRDGR
jgi:acyl-CoA reductase-like NAD-dependent aldehyde dehydrogenase